MMCRGSVAGIHLRPAGCSAPPGPQPADQDQPQAIQGLSRHVRAVPHEGDTHEMSSFVQSDSLNSDTSFF
jgi:hypothetical protein